MGFFDRLKQMLGSGEAAADDAKSPAPNDPASATGVPRKNRKGERPALVQPPPPSATLDEALEARDAGEKAKARAILRAIDRGAGLRTILRAAAALEDRDEEELARVLPSLAKAESPWRMHLQLAAALGEGSGAPHVARAEQLGAPAWAIAWARTATEDDEGKRRALVDLLFSDPAFARTVAARDLKIDGAHDDPSAIARYASLDAGRVAVRRFGVDAVRALVARMEK